MWCNLEEIETSGETMNFISKNTLLQVPQAFLAHRGTSKRPSAHSLWCTKTDIHALNQTKNSNNNRGSGGGQSDPRADASPEGPPRRAGPSGNEQGRARLVRRWLHAD